MGLFAEPVLVHVALKHILSVLVAEVISALSAVSFAISELKSSLRLGHISSSIVATILRSQAIMCLSRIAIVRLDTIHIERGQCIRCRGYNSGHNEC